MDDVRSQDLASTRPAWWPVEPEVRDLGQANGRVTVEGRMELACPADDLYEAISNFERSPEIFSNITQSSVTPTAAGKRVKQVCAWKFLIFSDEFELSLDVQEAFEDRQLVYKMDASKFMKFFEGQWDVECTGPGTCRAVHRLTVEPVLCPPPALSHYTNSIFTRQVEGIMQDLAAEMERQHYDD